MAERKQLVEQAKKGDAHAFSLLYEEIYVDLYRYAYFMLQNGPDAEDAVSEGVLAAFRGIHKLRREEAFRGWMFQIVTNICRRKRKEYSKKTVPLEENQTDWVEDSPEYLDVRRALKILSEEERQIVGMSVLAGYNSREIAKMLNLRASTVRSKLRRSLEKMRKLLV